MNSRRSSREITADGRTTPGNAPKWRTGHRAESGETFQRFHTFGETAILSYMKESPTETGTGPGTALTVDELAARAGVTVRTIRFYSTRGCCRRRRSAPAASAATVPTISRGSR